MTPVSVTLDPTTGMAKRIAITSTASVENPSMKAMIQGVGNRVPSVDRDVCTLTLLRLSGETKYYRAMIGLARFAVVPESEMERNATAGTDPEHRQECLCY